MRRARKVRVLVLSVIAASGLAGIAVGGGHGPLKILVAQFVEELIRRHGLIGRIHDRFSPVCSSGLPNPGKSARHSLSCKGSRQRTPSTNDLILTTILPAVFFLKRGEAGAVGALDESFGFGVRRILG